MASPVGTRRVLFFDIGGVLLDFEGLPFVNRMARQYGFKTVRALRQLWSSRMIERIELGTLLPEQLHAHLRSKGAFPGGYDEFARVWNSPFRLNERTAQLFARVAREHPVYLLSNTNRLHYEHIKRRYAFPRQAKGAVLSYELRMRKPESRIYRAALSAAGAAASSSVFIDDRRENVKAAERLGFKGIHYTGPRRLRRELVRLGFIER